MFKCPHCNKKIEDNELFSYLGSLGGKASPGRPLTHEEAVAMGQHSWDSRQETLSDEEIKAVKDDTELLTDRERLALRLRYGIFNRKHTLEEVADALDFTNREYTRQFVKKALKKLRGEEE